MDESGSEEKKEKTLRCWSCRRHGHRAGDRKCPKFMADATQTDRFRWGHEDPMRQYIEDRKRRQKEERIQQLKDLIEQTSSSSDSDLNGGRKSSKKKTHRRVHKKKKVKRLKSSHASVECDIDRKKSKRRKADRECENSDSRRAKHCNKHKHLSDSDDRKRKHKHLSDSNDRKRRKQEQKHYKDRKKDHNYKVKKHHKAKHKREYQ